MQNGANVSTAGVLKVWSGGRINLIEGTISASTLDISGSGRFNFIGGNLVVDSVVGDLINQGGTLSPGSSPGVTISTGNYTQQPGAALAIEVAANGGVPGVDFDQLQVNGLAILEGMVTVDLLGSFAPTSDITIVTTTDGITLPGAGLTLGGPDASLFSGISVSGNDLVLSVFDNLAGDFNGDGKVDGFDLLDWQRGGSPVPLSQLDYATWETNFGTFAPLTGSAVEAPEPDFVIMLMAAIPTVQLLTSRLGVRN